VIFQVK